MAGAIDPATEAELPRIGADLEQHRDVRVVVLTGAGERAFCFGADMKNPSTSGLEYWARAGGFGGIALRDGLTPLATCVNGAPQSEDSLEGVRAFQEKRKPAWKGR